MKTRCTPTKTITTIDFPFLVQVTTKMMMEKRWLLTTGRPHQRKIISHISIENNQYRDVWGCRYNGKFIPSRDTSKTFEVRNRTNIDKSSQRIQTYVYTHVWTRHWRHPREITDCTYCPGTCTCITNLYQRLMWRRLKSIVWWKYVQYLF